MVAGFANMWVVRGAVCSEAFLVWGSILGWIYAEERHHELSLQISCLQPFYGAVIVL